MKNLSKRIIKSDYTLSVIIKLVTAVIGVATSAFCTRFLGVKYKGDYQYISQIANIFVLVLNMGIYQSYSYNYKKYGPSIIQQYINICFCQFVLLLGAAGIMIAVSRDILLSMIVILVPFNILKLQYGNIVLIEKIKLNLVLSLFNSILMTICYGVLYFSTEPNILYVVGVTVIVDIITVVFYIFGLKVMPKFWDIDFTFMKSILRFGFIPMLSGLLATINYHIDIIFLKQIGLPEELSYYSLATNIINYVWMIPDAFKSVLMSKSGKKFDRENILFSSQFSSAFIFFCFAVFALTGKFILSFIYGQEFVYSYGVTLLLIVGAFSMSFFKLLGVVLVSQGRRIAHFVTLAISAAANIALNAILIPAMGMYGAAIASVCSYTICGVILLVYFCRLYNMNPVQLVIPSRESIKSLRNSMLSRRND